MSRSVRPTIYARPEPPKPVTYRVEWTGGLANYIPVKPPWWAPHSGSTCNVFRAPHADCDCGAEIPW